MTLLARVRRFALAAGLASGLAACCADDRPNSWSEDEWCNDPPPGRTADIEVTFVGLFKPDGTPWCIRDATVQVSQCTDWWCKIRAPFIVSDIYVGLLRTDGSMGRAGGIFPEDGALPVTAPCNLYVADTRRSTDGLAWAKCYWPLHYEVEAEGCEPVAASFTWNDNWYPWKSPDHDDWYVPVVMDCPGRAADGSLLETPGGEP